MLVLKWPIVPQKIVNWGKWLYRECSMRERIAVNSSNWQGRHNSVQIVSIPSCAGMVIDCKTYFTPEKGIQKYISGSFKRVNYPNFCHWSLNMLSFPYRIEF